MAAIGAIAKPWAKFGLGKVKDALCYAYGTSVVRKVDGKSEAVPIEAVKEGDQVLVRGASGLQFTAAVTVDLHAGQHDDVLTLTTQSGKQVSMTGGHMVPVHRAGKEELIPMREVTPGSHITVVNDEGNTELSEVVDVRAVEAVEGVANITTGSETLVVNGIVGSIHSEFTFRGIGDAVRPVVKLLNEVAGTRAARQAYRSAECMVAE